jgi:sialic acid synthase SpsE
MVYVVADPGSCWNNKRQYGFDLIRVAREAGAHAIKFQLFDQEFAAKSGNIFLPFELFREFHSFGKSISMPVTASVFNAKALELLMTMDVPFIKFSYSMRERTDWIKASMTVGRKTVVSCDVMSRDSFPQGKDLVRLWCVPQYPVDAELHFKGKFPNRFDGFSDHTLDYDQTVRAVRAGATWIEKHLTMPYSDITCPDSKFALKPDEFAAMCKEIS